jgi:hypothetical protein
MNGKVLALALCCAMALSAQANPWMYWSLSGLRPGRELTVETIAPKRKIKGVFMGRDDNGIALALKSGRSEVIARQDIRKVTAKRKAYNYAPLIGAGAGTAILGGIASRPRLDLAAEGIAIFAAIGAGVGTGIGFAVRAAGNDELIYEAPKR